MNDPDDPKAVVRAGYDRASYDYRPDAADVPLPPLLEQLAGRLTPGAAVVDLGCGNGNPVTAWLADRFDVLGVDLSPVQIDRARRSVPRARFLCGDMTDLDLPVASVDAVVAVYSLIHVPLEEQIALLVSIRRWLRPGGLLLATVGADAWTGSEQDWLGSGATMWWSHADEANYLRWLDETGFAVEERRFVPESDGGHVFVLASARVRQRTTAQADELGPGGERT